MASTQLSELRGMQRTQLQRKNKDELIDAVLALAAQDEKDSLTEITKKLTDVMTELDALKRLVTSPESSTNKKIAALEAQLEKQDEVIAKHQMYLESLDRKEREANLVILAVPDENEALDHAVTDEDKFGKVWAAMGAGTLHGSHRRLGRLTENGAARRARPILVTLRDKTLRSNILDHARSLKNQNEPYKKTYVKKDVHPTVRKEWQRLREVERKEKERPENVGCMICLDTRERKLYRDGCVIDSWKPQPFF